MQEVIHSRETGQYPLSIGTSLAIESLMGTHPERSGPTAPVLAYDEVWVNLRTLARNALGAVNTEQRKGITPEELATALFREMDFIATEIRNLYTIPVVFYASDMDLSKYTNAKLRKAKTNLQIATESLIVKALGRIYQYHRETQPTHYELKHFKLKIKPERKHKNAVIITHFPFDLTAEAEFKSLVLLESHTGAFKPKTMWYTKYLDGQGLARIPFTEKFLQIFGDKETFAPLDKAWRDDILEIAEKYKWTSATTNDRINYGLNSLKNKYLLDYYRKL